MRVLLQARLPPRNAYLDLVHQNFHVREVLSPGQPILRLFLSILSQNAASIDPLPLLL